MIIYFSIALAFLYSLLYPRSKVLSGFLFLFILSVYVFISSAGHDMYYYGIHFANVDFDKPSMSLGFDYLTILIRNLGFSFLGFRIIINVIWMTLLFLMVRRYSSVPNVVLVFSMLFPNLIFGINMRTGISYIIVLYCTKYLLEEGVLPIIKFLTGLFIAIIIHPTSAIFIILLLARFYLNNRKYLTMIAVVSGITAVLLNTGIPNSIISSFTANERVLQWVRDGFNEDFYNILTALIIAVMQVFCLIVSRVCYNHLKIYKSFYFPEPQDEIKMKYMELIQKINVIMIASIPFLFVSVSAYRYFCTVYLLNIIVMANCSLRKKPGDIILNNINLLIFISLSAFILWYILINWQGAFFEYLNAYDQNLIDFIYGKSPVLIR